MEIAVIILNWNGKKHLETYLPSVVRYSDFPNVKIIVGDNNSDDDSIEFITNNYPQIQIIKNDQNYGFAQGYNKVIEKVDAKYCILINSDIEVTQNWINPLLDVIKSDPKIAAVQPKIKSYTNRDYFEYAGAAGGLLDYLGYPFCRGRVLDKIEKDNGQYDDVTEIFWSSGAAMIIKKDLFCEVGGFDDDFFAHQEEIDLCFRLKNLGYKIFYCGKSTVYHLGGGTLQYESPNKTYLNFKNNLIMLCKNLTMPLMLWIIFVRLWLDLAAWFMFMFKGKHKMAFAINRAHSKFVFGFFYWFSKRKNIKHSDVKLYNESIILKYYLGKIK